MYARRRALPTKPPVPVWKWLLPAVAVAAGGYAAYHLATRPHDPPMQTQARSRTMQQDWQELRAFGPRGLGDPGHIQAADWLAAQFRALGYSVQELPLTVSRPVDQGSKIVAGQQTFAAQALYGAAGGEQAGRLVRVPPDASSEQMEQLGLRGQLALTTCPGGSWADLADRVLHAGAFGLVLIDDCAGASFEPVGNTPLPLLRVDRAQKDAILALAGQNVTLTSRVRREEVNGKTIFARHVDAVPSLVFGAHLDTLPGSLGANRDASGILTVLELARRAAATPLGQQAWFVVFDGQTRRMLGSDDFAVAHAYELRQTRAMLNFDGVGLNTELEADANSDLDPLIRRVAPQVRPFNEPRDPTAPNIGKAQPIIGNSDHLAFKVSGTRTVLLQRAGTDPLSRNLLDDQLALPRVRETADFAQNFATALLAQPWQPKEVCGLTGRDCR